MAYTIHTYIGSKSKPERGELWLWDYHSALFVLNYDWIVFLRTDKRVMEILGSEMIPDLHNINLHERSGFRFFPLIFFSSFNLEELSAYNEQSTLNQVKQDNKAPTEMVFFKKMFHKKKKTTTLKNDCFFPSCTCKLKFSFGCYNSISLMKSFQNFGDTEGCPRSNVHSTGVMGMQTLTEHLCMCRTIHITHRHGPQKYVIPHFWDEQSDGQKYKVNCWGSTQRASDSGGFPCLWCKAWLHLRRGLSYSLIFGDPMNMENKDVCGYRGNPFPYLPVDVPWDKNRQALPCQGIFTVSPRIVPQRWAVSPGQKESPHQWKAPSWTLQHSPPS